MGIDFLVKFRDRIAANGGSPLLIHHMTLPKGEKLLDDLAKAAVAMRFPVPLTYIEGLAAAKSCEEGGPVESDRHYFWAIIDIEKSLGIETIQLSDGADPGPPIPQEIIDQIVGKPLPYPLIVIYRGEPYVVVALYSDDESEPNIGDVWKTVSSVGLAPAKYFDLEG
jgi:hypothetical protein